MICLYFQFNLLFFLCFSSLFANAESYSLIEKTDNMLKTGQGLSVEELYEAAKSAYAIEEYSYAISFLSSWVSNEER